jgi:hypothetical protein
MTALTQTPANVGIGSSGTRTRIVQAGASVTQGMPVYLSTDSKHYPADANASAAAAKAVGIAITPASTDGWFVMQEGAGGLVNLGATLVVGETYVVGATSGQVNPIGDLASGHFPCLLGTAVSTSFIQTLFSFTGIARP